MSLRRKKPFVIKRYWMKGELPTFGRDLSSDRLKYLRIGKIIRVDYELGYVDLDWIDAVGGRSKIYMPAAFASPRSTIQGMPEEGSYVVCGWTRLEQNIEQATILNYLDLDIEAAHQYTLSRGIASQKLDEIQDIREKIGYNSIRHKRRKIYPGEIDLESTQGAEVYLDDNVYLSDNKLDEIEICSFDQSIRISSVQQYTSTEAARTWNGMITRELIGDQTNEFTQPTYCANGKKLYIVTDSEKPFDQGGKAFTEYRIEIYQKGDGSLQINEVNSGQDISEQKPFISFVLGTVVGNDKTNINRYSKVLRPQIFGNATAIVPTIDDLECLPEEYEKLASAFQLKFGQGTKIDIDKQGHLFTNFAASTGQHPLGSGRSWESNFDGSIKWLIGANSQNQQSFILDTKGSIRETLGTDNIKQRSKETIAQKCILTQIMGPDIDGKAYILKTVGDVDYSIKGNYNVEVSGDYKITVSGKITEEVLGTKDENYLKNKNNVYGGSFKETIIKDKQEVIGENRTVKITGTKDNVPVQPTTVTDSLEITSGTLEIKTMTGHVKINALLQTVEVSGTMKVTLKSGVKIEALAMAVDLGQAPARGGLVLGNPTPTHMDFIVGSPLGCSTSVKAST